MTDGEPACTDHGRTTRGLEQPGEYEHSESEPEGEEGSVEWEETPILSLVKATDFPEAWHMLRRMNMQWHERLIASRFLDPPDGSVAV